ncbi:Imidazolonepropionase [Fictibacillus solisalsi]|uniref:Imidazolonepropionase n=1 Tax=Fictibacillus solisalsi TaxID=459525 RepID=A0A1G9TDS7_9BACL|nr:amidohydrolase [Fictibacillus solisalsi]SDM45846.1 Imidazolonepropionase [Fictibacillus solisalsi]
MLLIKNGMLMTGTGMMYKGDVLLGQGKIAGIGEISGLPETGTVLDAEGKFVTPGLIDVHTHLGIHEEGIGPAGHDYNETSNPVTPYVRAIDGINPNEKGFEDARKAGVTTVQVMPGSANVIGGEMVVLKTAGTVIDQMVIRNPSGMKAAFGENPKRFYGGKGKAPVTRMGIAALFRKEMKAAQHALKKLEKGEELTPDLGIEHLIKVLKKEIPIRAHAHRADDIATILRLATEFGFDLTIEHCTEGHQIASFIAEHHVRVSVGPTLSTRSKIELADKGWHTLKELNAAGVPVSITTDHPVVGIDSLILSAISAVKHGLQQETAWQAITLNAARHLGVEDRVGSLEKGKDADVVIWDGDPFDARSTVETTIINGAIVYDHSIEK